MQIENGDLAIEDGDLKFVPDFNKDDIVGFINWFETEKTEFIDYLKAKGVKVRNTINLNEDKVENKITLYKIIEKWWWAFIIPLAVGVILIAIEKGWFK